MSFEDMINAEYSGWTRKNWHFFANDLFQAREMLPWAAVDEEYEEMRELYFRYQ